MPAAPADRAASVDPTTAADAWWQRVEAACRAARFGDAALLAGEAATPEAVARARQRLAAARRQPDAAGTPPTPPPRQVLLFSGHRVDAPGRPLPRFPASAVPHAARRIEAVLDRLGAGPTDLALTQGADGGDLLFAAAAADRGMRVSLLLPLALPAFLATSVAPARSEPHDGSDSSGRPDPTDWLARWAALQPRLAEPPRAMPEALGPVPAGADPWERANRWLLATALAAVPAARLQFVCLWDGGAGDGPGGTRHLVDAVRRCRCRIHRIDSRELLPR